MCLLCANSAADERLKRRGHVLQLLGLLEQPDALSARSALRVARQILALAEAEGAFRCEAVATAEPRLETPQGTPS